MAFFWGCPALWAGRYAAGLASLLGPSGFTSFRLRSGFQPPTPHRSAAHLFHFTQAANSGPLRQQKLSFSWPYCCFFNSFSPDKKKKNELLSI